MKNWKNLCPICLERETYKKTEKVKQGYSYVDDFGQYKFSQTGWRENFIEWWCCKKCAKNTPIDEFIKIMIRVYGKTHPTNES